MNIRRISGETQRSSAAPGALDLPPSLVRSAALICAVACGTNNTFYEPHYHTVATADASAPEPTPAADGGVAPELLASGAPRVDTEPGALQLDVFGTPGNRYWFQASPEQVALMNIPYAVEDEDFRGDRYTPHVDVGAPTFVDHLLVTSAGAEPHTADFGKVEVRLVGESTGRRWTTETLPNFKLDADEFIPGNRIGGLKHLRLNSGILGGMFREKLVYDVFTRLGYPAPRATFAWVSGSVWKPDVAVPYVLVESYKPNFCTQREAQLGGGCANMWELAADIGYGALSEPESCQFSTCEVARGEAFERAVAETAFGEGYKIALEGWLDWPAFHRFQCISWMLELADDALRNFNNVVLVERADAKFQYLPYSVDSSLSPDFGPISLGGVSTIAVGCQSDSQCWADTITACEAVHTELVAAAPVQMLDALYASLEGAGMLRRGDERDYQSLREHLEERLEALPAELALNRPAPVMPFCVLAPLEPCGPYCVLPEQCIACDLPTTSPEGADAGAAVSQPAETPGDCLPGIEGFPEPAL